MAGDLNRAGRSWCVTVTVRTVPFSSPSASRHSFFSGSSGKRHRVFISASALRRSDDRARASRRRISNSTCPATKILNKEFPYRCRLRTPNTATHTHIQRKTNPTPFVHLRLSNAFEPFLFVRRTRFRLESRKRTFREDRHILQCIKARSPES
jgi:hypothetical protein